MKITLTIIFSCVSMLVCAQIYHGDYAPATKVLIKFDPAFPVIQGDIPFDKIFTLRLYKLVQADLPMFVFLLDKNKMPVYYESLKISIVDPPQNLEDANLKNGYFAIDILIPALDPNTEYVLSSQDGSTELLGAYASILIQFSKGKLTDLKKTYKNTILENELVRAKPERLQQYYQTHKQEIDKNSALNESAAKQNLVEFLKSNSTLPEGNVRVNVFAGVVNNQVNTYQSGLATSAAFNLVADAGVIFCGLQKGFTTLVPYAGINYSFRSFDSTVPFHYLRKRLSPFDRLAIHAGLTLNSLAKDGYRSNLFGSNNLILGAGYKFSHVVSVTAGGLLFNKLSPNPLIDDKNLSVVPYFGLSINLKIKDAFGDIAKIFNYAK